MNLNRAINVVSLPLSALGLAIGYVALLLSTVQTLGYTRDEGFYFQAASSYARWFELLFSDRTAAFDVRNVDGPWSVNHEHPGLIKSLFALSWTYLERRWHLFAMEGTSFRFPAMVLAGVAVALVFIWGAQVRGRFAGFVAAVSLAAMPRFFFHAHLACFDVPIVAMWTLALYTYWRSLRDGGFLWPVVTGVCFGLALATKHNSWFLPIAAGAHYLALEAWAIASLTPLARYLPRPPAAGRVRKRAWVTLASVVVISPLVFYSLWPWLWHDTMARFWAYVQFHRNHEYYHMEFLGKTYWTPPMPRGYAWVMTLATVPAVTLVLFAVGLGAMFVSVGAQVRLRRVAPAERTRKKRGRRAANAPPRARPVDGTLPLLLWLAGLLVNYAAWLSTDTPIFGGTKHWMTAYPFLALFAGAGFSLVARSAVVELYHRRRDHAFARKLAAAPTVVFGCAAFAVLVAPIVEALHAHPWGLSTYTPLIGGAPGGASLGLNRGFWGYTTGSAAGFLDERAPRGASVFLHDTAGQAWDMLLRDGRVRRDLRAAWSIVGADYGLYHEEQHMSPEEYQNWVAFGTVRPAYIGGLDGVPVILVYEDPRVAKAVGRNP